MHTPFWVLPSASVPRRAPTAAVCPATWVMTCSRLGPVGHDLQRQPPSPACASWIPLPCRCGCLPFPGSTAAGPSHWETVCPRPRQAPSSQQRALDLRDCRSPAGILVKDFWKRPQCILGCPPASGVSPLISSPWCLVLAARAKRGWAWAVGRAGDWRSVPCICAGQAWRSKACLSGGLAGPRHTPRRFSLL